MPMMGRALSIKARLSVVFIFLFALVMVLGLESLSSLSHVNDASVQIRDRWLPSTRALGDLNNYTTDFPAAEAALLRADGVNEQSAIDRQVAHLDREIAVAEQAFREIRHDSVDDLLFARFGQRWTEYREVVARSRARSGGSAEMQSGRSLEAAAAAAYEAASAVLAQLTARNVAGAREAGERSDLAYAQATRHIALTIVLAGLLAAGAMLHVTRSISAPLVDLAGRMHRLAASETSIEVHGIARRDEIGEMARAVLVFRNNAIDLAQNRHALALQAERLQERLAEEQRLTLLQRNFVSMASHEFRTPLGIIDGHAQRMISMRDRLTAGELTERARKVRDAVRRMTQLIADLIGSARLIDGRIGLSFRPIQVDLTALLREVCQLQRELTPEARILSRLQDAPLTVSGDPGLLSQMFGNLISNAVKYSPNGGPVTLAAMLDGEHAIVEIEDRGIGIPDVDRQRVFERYYRGSNISGISGSGVGLYLVRTIIDLHHGVIQVDSREGEGSRFTLRLPVGEAAVRDAGRATRELDLVT